jgi:hypothetical protein
LSFSDPVGPYSLFTKFKVQWSASDTFAKISGEKVVVCSSDEGQRLECVVDHLKEGQVAISYIFTSCPSLRVKPGSFYFCLFFHHSIAEP